MSLELLKVSFAAFGIHVLFFLFLYTLTVFFHDYDREIIDWTHCHT